MDARFDVIVVGGGPVGAACARELAVSGRSVLVVERGADRGEGWRAAAGMLAPQIETLPEHPLFEVGLAGRERYAHLAVELLQGTGVDIGLWQEGIAHFAGDEALAADLRAAVALQRQAGQHCEWLDAAEVKARWPWAGPAHGALWAPREGALDPVRLVEALRLDVMRRGGVIREDEVVRLERAGDRVTGVVGRSGTRYSAPDVILAAGAWSGLVEGLPRPLSVEPIRGQMAAVPWPAQVPPAVIYGKHCYVVYRDGEMLIGATREYSGFVSEVTPEGIREILAAAAAIYPALATATPARTWAGLRPGTPDGLPIVGAEPRLKGLWYATGHGRNGILLAGITGTALRELLDGEPPREELWALRPERLWES